MKKNVSRSILHKITAVLLLCCLLALQGCTPYKEIKELSIVEGMGFDRSGSSSFSLTFQIFNPKSTDGNQKGKNETGQENILATGEGLTIYDAIRNATLTIGKKLYFSNASVYIVSESICRDNFSNLIDFMERAPEIRPTERLFVAKGNASDILSAKKDDQIISADEIKKMADSYYTSSKIMDFTIQDIYNAESGGIQDLALAAVKVQSDSLGNTSVMMDGTAVFRKNKLAGYLDLDETRGVLWIMGKVKSGIVVVYPSAGGKVSMEVSKGKSDISVLVRNGTPSITVNVSFGTDIAEMETKSDVTLNAAFINELTALQNQAVTNEIEAALSKCLKEYGADIFGFGCKIYEDQPETWKNVSAGWNDRLKNLQVTVHVSSHVDYSGVITNKITN